MDNTHHESPHSNPAVTRFLPTSRFKHPQWTILQQRPGLTVYELVHAPLSFPSLFIVLHLRSGAVVFAQPLYRPWGTSITNGAEGLVRVAADQFRDAGEYYEWYFDKGSFDRILYDPTTDHVEWRHHTRERFERERGLHLPNLAVMPIVLTAEQKYAAQYR